MASESHGTTCKVDSGGPRQACRQGNRNRGQCWSNERVAAGAGQSKVWREGTDKRPDSRAARDRKHQGLVTGGADEGEGVRTYVIFLF